MSERSFLDVYGGLTASAELVMCGCGWPQSDCLEDVEFVTDCSRFKAENFTTETAEQSPPESVPDRLGGEAGKEKP